MSQPASCPSAPQAHALHEVIRSAIDDKIKKLPIFYVENEGDIPPIDGQKEADK